ncbi:MAG: xylulokinase [Pseudomonadota bacterium]
MFLGLDLGTSGLKALLMDDAGQVRASAQAPLSVARPRSGWSEQDPAHWIGACRAAVTALSRDHGQDMGAVVALGLSGQMHGATVIDAADRVLNPAILWNDTRAHTEAAAMDADPQFRAKTGNIVFPGFTAPKLAWLARQDPDRFDAAAKVLLPKDYLRLWLTGDYLSDLSDASGTAWLDVGARDWSDDLLAATGLTRDHMPGLVEGSAPGGALRAAVAAELGLPAGIPVAGGAGDNAASAVGVGVVEPGTAFLSLGTSGVLFVASAGYAPDPDTALHTFCHALPERWHQMGVILSATDALAWAGGVLGTAPETLTADLGDLAAPGRALFLPYLGGERTPHNDAQVRGALIGIEHATDRAALVRAVLEGVTFAFLDSLRAMQATGTAPARLIAVGGGSRSRAWLAMLATALGLPVDVPVAGDFGAAYGAARLGAMAAGHLTPGAASVPDMARTVVPDPALADAFAAGHARYMATYSALKELS